MTEVGMPDYIAPFGDPEGCLHDDVLGCSECCPCFACSEIRKDRIDRWDAPAREAFLNAMAPRATG